MRNMLALFGALVLGFAGVGWYMEWYKLSFTKSSDGNLQIETNVDTKKVVQDAGQLGNLLNKSGSQNGESSRPAPGNTPGPASPTQTDGNKWSGGWLFGQNSAPSNSGK